MFEIQRVTIKHNHGYPSYELLDDYHRYLFDTESEAKSYLDDYLKRGGFTGEICLSVPILDELNYKIGFKTKAFPKNEAYRIVERKVYNQKEKTNPLPFEPKSTTMIERETVDNFLEKNRGKFKTTKVPRLLTSREGCVYRGNSHMPRIFTYMDEVTKYEFMSFKSAGIGAWNELQTIINQS